MATKKDRATEAGPTRPARGAPERIFARETRELPVKLTAAELQARGALIGQKMGILLRIELQAAAAKDHYKAEATRTRKEIEQLGEVLEKGTEVREVECEVVLNWHDATRDTRRTDTGDVVDSRALSPKERQQELFRQGPGGRKGKRGQTPPADAAPAAAGDDRPAT